MGIYLSDRERSQLRPAETAAFDSPVPTQMISNGEFNPLPQTAQQRRVEARITKLADTNARRLGVDRYKCDNFRKEIHFDSDTRVDLLSDAPFDNPDNRFLSNDPMRQAARSKLAYGYVVPRA